MLLYYNSKDYEDPGSGRQADAVALHEAASAQNLVMQISFRHLSHSAVSQDATIPSMITMDQTCFGLLTDAYTAILSHAIISRSNLSSTKCALQCEIHSCRQDRQGDLDSSDQSLFTFPSQN